MTYAKSNVITAGDFNLFAGSTESAAANATAATSVAGHLWGVGYGDRGFGETSPILSAATTGSVIKGSDWENLNTVVSNLANWTRRSLTDMPVGIGSGKLIQAHTGNGIGNINTMLSLIDANRFDYDPAKMTTTLNAATTTRSSSWSSTITCEFTVTFSSVNEARYFFNTGGEIRISLSHPNTSSSQNSSWNTVLNGFVASFRANDTARTGGSYGSSTAVGYYDLTASYQTIINGTDAGGVFPYNTNDFFVDAKVATLITTNGGTGAVINFRIRLIDSYSNAGDFVSSGTAAAIGFMRATGSPLTAKTAPTCTVTTTFG